MPLHNPDRKIVHDQFHIEQEVKLSATREKVFEALLDPSAWWCHHFAPAQPDLRLDPRVGGLFCEYWADPRTGEKAHGAYWGTVTYIKRPEVLRLSGPLGMNLPVSSVYEYALAEPSPGATTLKLSHYCVGLLDSNWRDAHDTGWGMLWTSLRQYVERGERYIHKPK